MTTIKIDCTDVYVKALMPKNDDYNSMAKIELQCYEYNFTDIDWDTQDIKNVNLLQIIKGLQADIVKLQQQIRKGK